MHSRAQTRSKGPGPRTTQRYGAVLWFRVRAYVCACVRHCYCCCRFFFLACVCYCCSADSPLAALLCFTTLLRCCCRFFFLACVCYCCSADRLLAELYCCITLLRCCCRFFFWCAFATAALMIALPHRTIPHCTALHPKGLNRMPRWSVKVSISKLPVYAEIR